MAEDDDVVFEGQELQKYLCELGLQDFEVVSPNILISPKEDNNKSITSKYFTAINSSLHSTFKWFASLWMPIIRPVDYDVLCKHMNLILECGLLFEDDVHFVNNVLPDSQSENQEVSVARWNCRIFSIVSTFHWFCCNLWNDAIWPITGSVIVCVLWSWKRTHQNTESLNRQENLLQVMKNLYTVFWKSMKLLQENELILRGFTLAKTGSTASRLENSELPCMIRKWDSSPGLRIAVAQAFLEAISVLTDGTQQLITCCPLFGQLDNASHYMSYLDEKSLGLVEHDKESDVKLSHLKRLHHIFLLLQSEFLRRLALCFCPELWKWKSLKQIQHVMKTVFNVTENSSRLYSNLVREYHVFYSYGTCERIQESNLLPPIQKSVFLKTTDSQVAVRSASLHLQVLLLNTRALEEKLEDTNRNEDENLEDVLSHLSNIIKELDTCKSCCEEGILQIKKSSIPVVPNEVGSDVSIKNEETNDKCVNTDLEVKVVQVGYTDLDPQVEDEVFVAVVPKECENRKTSLQDEIMRNEQIQYEMAKQLSKKMMQELKSVLIVKAEKWKEREAKALQAKHHSPESIDGVSDTMGIKEENEMISRISSLKEDQTCGSVASHSFATNPKVNSFYSSSHRKESPQHKLLHGYRAESDCSLDRCTDSPVSNASSSGSQAVCNKSPKHMYASETFRPLQNDLQFSVGLYLSSDALAKFQARNVGGSDTFSGVGEKSSSEESLVDE